MGVSFISSCFLQSATAATPKRGGGRCYLTDIDGDPNLDEAETHQM